MKDTLDIEEQNFKYMIQQHSLSGRNQKNARYAMQNLYKLQLDEVMNEKNKIKERQKELYLNQKKDFTQKAIQNQQQERMKEKAYKNYYEMLSKNQEDHKNKFVSSESLRSSLKNNHIQHSIEEGQMKMKQLQILQRQRQLQTRNRYKQELMNQIQEKRKADEEQRQMKRRSQEQFQKYGKLPSELSKFERQKHREDMIKYKEDLDKIRNQNAEISRSRSEKHAYNVADGQHHLFLNPLPYNIQNPYILKQMRRETYNNNKVIHDFNKSPIH